MTGKDEKMLADFQRPCGFISRFVLKALSIQLLLVFTVTLACAAPGPDQGGPVQGRPEASSEQPLQGQVDAEARQVPVALPEPALPGGVKEVASEEQGRARRPQGTGTVALNFSDASLGDILRTITELTGENFILAPGISARISIQTSRPVAQKDVLGIFESILEVNGLAAIKNGAYYKIMPAAAARQHAVELFRSTGGFPQGDRLMSIVAPVEFVSANDVIQILKPMLSAAGNIVNYQKANTLIITDTASNIKGLLEIIDAIDVNAFRKMSIALVQAKNVDVKTLDRELADIFAALGYGSDAAQLVVVPIDRLNTVALFASSEVLMASAREWIERLDQSSSADTDSIHVYYVQNDKASTVGDMIEQLYSSGKPSSAALKPSSPSLSSQGSPRAAPAAGAQPAAPVTQPRPDIGAKGEGGASGDGVKIYVYEPSNALIIQCSQRDYQSILSTLKELDRPPKQVLIEALIAEVKLDDTLKYGIQWSVISGNANIQQNTGIFQATIADPKVAITAPIGQIAPGGLTAVATDASRFFAAIQALSTDGKINVLSNPHILVKNYEKASINVGSDEPVATQSTQTAVTGTSGLIQTIEYRKTGIILTVVPQITDGGMVSMTIRQEVSDKSTDRTVGNAIYPSFTKREAETSVVARDGESLVIGGLIQDRNEVSASGIPLLSKIPLLGPLFRFTTKTAGKTELVILLTPKIVSNPGQAATVSSEVKGKLKGVQEYLMKKNYGK